ncbi:hypothetical protein L596_014019 [Steinernema carpocapsae]|uniref:Uncharacterized protein n=1 Tax=Steinernema carpocapsae TaxID=34508 RepID=A0A4U5NBF6_STECR|nr:hypothetical protein L596_014019 [Steinernema carpocapsae]
MQIPNSKGPFLSLKLQKPGDVSRGAVPENRMRMSSRGAHVGEGGGVIGPKERKNNQILGRETGERILKSWEEGLL